MKSTLLVVLYAETPLHAGSGVGLGAVDLPIQRERMSGLPMVQGSGIKGALRERMRPYKDSEPHSALAGQKGRLDENDFVELFGPYAPPRKDEAESPDNDGAQSDGAQSDGAQPDAQPKPDEFAGAISLTDARILLFPVRTAFGGFAWLTCPLILDRLKRDLRVLDIKKPEGIDALRPGEGQALVNKESAVCHRERLIIEDMDYTAAQDKGVDALAAWLAEHAFPRGDEYEPFRRRIAEQLAVVDDTEFAFLSKHATEVVARTRIDSDTGTVQRGALWTEESLPAETVLWAAAMFADSRTTRRQGKKSEALRTLFAREANKLSRIYLGGDRSVGRGMMALHVLGDGLDGGDQ